MDGDTTKKYRTRYEKEMIEYFRDGFEGINQGSKTAQFPTFEMFAFTHIGVSMDDIEYWRGLHPKFKDAYDTCRAYQEQALITGGLKGYFRAPIVKIMLAKYGYSDAPVAPKDEDNVIPDEKIGDAIQELINKTGQEKLKELGLNVKGIH